jgi:hypothetical protein
MSRAGFSAASSRANFSVRQPECQCRRRSPVYLTHPIGVWNAKAPEPGIEWSTRKNRTPRVSGLAISRGAGWNVVFLPG